MPIDSHPIATPSVDPDDFRQTPDPRPEQIELILPTIQAVPQPNRPRDVKIRPGPGHQMPPAMPLQQDPPRQAQLPPPALEAGAIHNIERPDAEAAQEGGKPDADHQPHGLQDLLIPAILPARQLLLIQAHGPAVLEPVLGLGILEARPERELHDVHLAEDDDEGQEGVDALVELGVLEVVVVQGDADAEEGEAAGETGFEPGGARVGEGGVAHEASCVDHVQFVDELPGIFWGSVSGHEGCNGREAGERVTFECRVEAEAPDPHQEVAYEADMEDSIMAVFDTASKA